MTQPATRLLLTPEGRLVPLDPDAGALADVLEVVDQERPEDCRGAWVGPAAADRR